MFAAWIAGMALWSARSEATHGRSDHVELLIAITVGIAALLLAVAAWRVESWQRTPAGVADTEAPADGRDWLLMVLLTLVAAVPRIAALRHSLWYDELWTVNFMIGGPVFAVTHQAGYNNHLLNSLLGSLLIDGRNLLTGYHARTAGDWLLLARVPAVVFGVAAVPALYGAARGVLGRSVALTAAVLLALSPAAVDFSSQARGYSAVIFFSICQVHALRVAVRGRPVVWLLWLILAVLGTFAHLYVLFPVIAAGLTVLGLAVHRLLAARDGAGARRLLEPGVLFFGSWAVLTVACYAAILATVRNELQREALTQPMARAHEVIGPLLQSWVGVPQSHWLPTVGTLCVLFAVAGVALLRRRAPATGIYLTLLLLLPPVLVEAARPHYVYIRFFAFGLPAFLLWMACGIQEIAGWLRSRFGPQVAAIVGACLGGVLLATMSHGLQQVVALPKQDYTRAAHRLTVASRQGTAIAATGAGAEFLSIYHVRAFQPRSADDLVAFVRKQGHVLMLDTDLTVNIHTPPPGTTLFLRANGGKPVTVYPGRFAGWPYRWLDGDSDFKIYDLRAADLASLPQPPKAH